SQATTAYYCLRAETTQYQYDAHDTEELKRSNGTSTLHDWLPNKKQYQEEVTGWVTEAQGICIFVGISSQGITVTMQALQLFHITSSDERTHGQKSFPRIIVTMFYVLQLFHITSLD
ncbi:hypothetical protein ACJX0J_041165, partial [Zea mays]